MKLSLALIAICAVALSAQNLSPQLKHLAVYTSTSLQPVRVAALEIMRDIPYNAIDHLSGAVEVKTPVCIPVAPGTARACAGFVVLRADRAEFHEDTGQIEASGNVRVTREP
jgi:lipopolysaccharide assembly outer membrane protein LptD (OstA)